MSVYHIVFGHLYRFYFRSRGSVYGSFLAALVMGLSAFCYGLALTIFAVQQLKAEEVVLSDWYPLPTLGALAVVVLHLWWFLRKKRYSTLYREFRQSRYCTPGFAWFSWLYVALGWVAMALVATME